jgi:hypothetical protein
MTYKSLARTDDDAVRLSPVAKWLETDSRDARKTRHEAGFSHFTDSTYRYSLSGQGTNQILSIALGKQPPEALASISAWNPDWTLEPSTAAQCPTRFAHEPMMHCKERRRSARKAGAAVDHSVFSTWRGTLPPANARVEAGACASFIWLLHRKIAIA